MTFVVDNAHLGTPESKWLDSGPLLRLPPLEYTTQRIVVVAPHPDDEVFGAGGLLQLAQARGVAVEIIAVSDGERAECGLPKDLRMLRSAETREALRRLGLGQVARRRLQLPDGEIASCTDALSQVLVRSLRPNDLCIAPWVHDGHPDHDACGRVALDAAKTTGARALGYLVWAWHWSTPEGAEIPWPACRRVDLPRRVAARKRWSTGSFVSQTRAPNPVLPPSVIRRFYRPFEVFVDMVL
jgi:LmbE family N-acetylglucosaminyl deacetylase